MAILLVLFELAPPVLLGRDACVATVDDPCHVEGDGEAHVDAHPDLAAGTPHQDMGAGPAHEHACACMCHTPLVLRAAPLLLTVAAVAPLPVVPPGTLFAGHPTLPFRPPRLS